MAQEINKTYKIDLDKVVWGSLDKNTYLIKFPRALKTAIFELNGVGLEIWKMLLKNYDSRKILKNLTKKYRLPKKQIEADFAKLITQLIDNKIINEIH